MVPGSVRVRKGQEVRRGQVLGLLGNSGNTSTPHLHFQVSDRPGFAPVDSLPYVFSRFAFLGQITDEFTDENLALRPTGELAFAPAAHRTYAGRRCRSTATCSGSGDAVQASAPAGSEPATSLIGPRERLVVRETAAASSVRDDASAASRPYGHRMGLFRNRTDEPGGERFLMREKLLSIGDDFWIENEEGERAYKVDGKAVRVRQTFILEDASGNEVARIQERKLSIRDKVAIERDGDTVATVHKALVGIRDRFSIDLEDGDDMKAKGNVVDHEYEIERDGDTVATISRKWFRVRESYGVDVAADADVPLILAITVAIDSLTTRD